jgi:hypothetical protein
MMAVLPEPGDDRTAEMPGASGDEDVHRGLLPRAMFAGSGRQDASATRGVTVSRGCAGRFRNRSVSAGTRSATALQRKRRRRRPPAASRKGHKPVAPPSAARLLESMLPTLWADRGPPAGAYKRRRNALDPKRPAGRGSTRPRAPPSQVDRSGRASTSPRSEPGRFNPSYAPASEHALRGSRCSAASALRPASHPRIA